MSPEELREFHALMSAPLFAWREEQREMHAEVAAKLAVLIDDAERSAEHTRQMLMRLESLEEPDANAIELEAERIEEMLGPVFARVSDAGADRAQPARQPAPGAQGPRARIHRQGRARRNAGRRGAASREG